MKYRNMKFRCAIPATLSGRTAVVTGSSSGIGFELAKELLRRDCSVVITGRSQERCEQSLDMIKESLADMDISDKAVACSADLSDFEQVYNLADNVKQRFQSLDFLLLNAGMIYADFNGPTISESSGRDLLYTSNCLGPFLLTKLLLELVEKSTMPGAIVFTGSVIQWYCSSSPQLLSSPNKFKDGAAQALEAYANSKLALSVYAAELEERLKKKGSRVVVRSFAPGMVKTSLKIPRDKRCNVTGSGESNKASSFGNFNFEKRFEANQAALYTLMSVFPQDIDAETKDNLHLHLIGPYRLPGFIFWGSTRFAGIRTAILWIMENMQKFTADDQHLYAWPNPAIVADSELRKKLWNEWDGQLPN
mmetsp:Transcript_3751/g.5078  ORF Transcript_3751/g.5078 Transcript_3751/m.5078 type:complete len:363 (-) Transcript_3751:1523-2611(-)